MPSEFELIARYFTRAPRTALLGVGDDCALVKAPDGLALAISTDMLVEGTHFFAATDPQALGHKTLAVNLSDLAAMGADPRWVTLALALPTADEAWVAAFARGFFAIADRFDIELIGGDTTRGPLNLCVTVIGTSPKGLALRRDGARVGDDVWLSGETGAASLAVALRRGELELDAIGTIDATACALRLDQPEPRVALGRALRTVASSAIDVSDGLAADLGHIAERSRVAIMLEWHQMPIPTVLRHLDTKRQQQAVLAGGDDYELAFTAAPDAAERVRKAADKAGVVVTRIGRVAAGAGVQVIDAAGQQITPDRAGFDHFGA